METDFWESCFLQEGLEYIKDISCWIEMRSDRCREHVVVLLPERACFELCLKLLDTVLLERFYSKSRKHNTAPSFIRLWFSFFKTLAWEFARNPRENTAYL